MSIKTLDVCVFAATLFGIVYVTKQPIVRQKYAETVPIKNPNFNNRIKRRNNYFDLLASPKSVAYLSN